MNNDVPPHIAILIGAPHGDQISIHNDVSAMYGALRRRAITAEDILCLEGKLDRRIVLGFLDALHGRIRTWQEGAIFFHISGHGFFTGESVEEARVGLELQPAEALSSEYHVFWDEMLQTLAPPDGVSLTLLPDH